MATTKRSPAKRRPKTRGRGRPPFEPTGEQRKLVARQAAFGMPHASICGLILKPDGKPLTEKTLKAHFGYELANCAALIDVNVVNSLYDQAVGRLAIFDEKGNQLAPSIAPSPAAAIFWCKARLGWREKIDNQHSGPDGGAIPIRLESLTDAQLGQLIERIEGAIRNRAG